MTECADVNEMASECLFKASMTLSTYPSPSCQCRLHTQSRREKRVKKATE